MSWTSQELVDLELYLPQSKSKKSEKIRKEVQCKARALLKRDQWSESDDKLLLFLHDLYKGDLKQIQLKFSLKSDIQIQRRIRYLKPEAEPEMSKRIKLNMSDNQGSQLTTQQVQNSQELIDDKVKVQVHEEKVKVKQQRRPYMKRDKNIPQKAKKPDQNMDDNQINYAGKSYLKQVLNQYFVTLLKKQKSQTQSETQSKYQYENVHQTMKKFKFTDIRDLHVLHQLIVDIQLF